MGAFGVKQLLQGLGRILLVMVFTGVTLIANVSANPQAAQVEDNYPVYIPSLHRGQTLWTYHKTADGLHPDGNEQQMMWLMNRARANPTQEGVWLATTTEGDISFPRDYFNVSLSVLQSEFASYAVKPPAAFDVRLYNAARVHSEDLIARNAQDHTNQFQRVKDAGYVYSRIRGNVFSYSDNGLNAHAGFNIDWGGSPTDGDATDDGMQYTRGHRKAIMSLDGDYCNVGIAMVPVTVPNKNVGPFVTTGNYAYPHSTGTNQYSRFIVGTVWRDQDGDSMYDPGEGLNNVTVKAYPGEYYAVTAIGGGYAIPILTAGTYTVNFLGAVSGSQQVVVGASSVLVDLKIPTLLAERNGTQAEQNIPSETFYAPPPAISE